MKPRDLVILGGSPGGLVVASVAAQLGLRVTLVEKSEQLGGELVHEIVLAMQTGAKIRDLSAAIHAYPTLAQIHRRAANTAYAHKLFSPGTRTLVKWLHRLWPS
ncbi:MAG: FAD-dependent oxidoreductase [Xanthomonadaceae bacterium]|nr:FAD-dependent oxidoreductase [Xanthomonadaceae bacterium]